MNLILLLVLVLEVCIGIAAWLSPQWLRAVSAHLLTRADALELISKEEQRRMQLWSAELGLDARRGEESTEDRRVRVLARH